MSTWGRITMATRAAAGAFIRTWNGSPANQARQDWIARASHYEHMWALWENTKFEDAARWDGYKARYGLGRTIRMIYNPARRLTDFYAGAIYPGVLSADGRNLPDGTRLAIPLAEDTPPELRSALGQIWQWSNWQAGKSNFPRWGSMLGNVLVEIVDDLDRGQVRLEMIYPGHIIDLDRDNVGNVLSYEYEYSARDEDRETEYIYKRRVDREAIREYYDSRLINEYANPYGFAPARWVPHTDTGTVWGSPAFRNISKWDELNDQASAVADRVRLIMKSPIILWGGGAIAGATETQKAGQTSAKANEYEDREKLKLLTGPAGGDVGGIDLAGIEEAYHHIDRTLREIEHDHPELTMYQALRQMSQVTGPAAERMLGDVVTLVDEARGNYDHHSVKLFQMAITIAGHRANAGDWGRNLTPAQAKFLPYDLDSYAAGDLNFEIMPRPVVPETPRERLERQRMEMALEREATAPQVPAGGVEARVAAMR